MLFRSKKDEPLPLDQSKEALNWSITAILGYMGCLMMTGMFAMSFNFILMGLMSMVIAALFICHVVFCVMGVIASAKLEKFRVPFAIRLIK